MSLSKDNIDPIPESEIRERYANAMQVLANMVMANVTALIAGRRTGKTTGVIGPRIQHIAQAMPRCSIGLINLSYRKARTDLIPQTLIWFNRNGYKEDRHYFKYKYAPDKFKIPKPLISGDPIHSIHLHTGAALRIISMDRGGGNGPDLDFAIVDETRLHNKEKLDNGPLPALGGTNEFFGDVPDHRGVLYTTDMPLIGEHDWIYEYEKLQKNEQIQAIIEASRYRTAFYLEWLQTKSPAHLKAFNKWNNLWNKLRFNSVQFLNYPSHTNVLVLGMDYILRQQLTLDPDRFAAAIMGIRPKSRRGSFYPYLSADKHGYRKNNYYYIDQLPADSTEEDCQWDADLVPGLPIHISFDHNAAINTLNIHQIKDGDMYTIKSMDASDDDKERLLDLLIRFDKYYKTHQGTCPDIFYWYDHNSTQTDSRQSSTIAQDVVQFLSNQGWYVYEEYVGQAFGHTFKYNVWEAIHNGDPELPKWYINLDNAEHLFTAMQRCRVKDRSIITSNERLEKDKSEEKAKDGVFPVHPRLAPHYTDAEDVFVVGYVVKYHSLVSHSIRVGSA